MKQKRILWITAVVIALFALTAAAPDARAQVRSRSYTFTGGGDGTRLGVMLEDVTSRLKSRDKLSGDEGAYVSDVVEESPAEKAGIQEGDVITSIDGKPIKDAQDLTLAVKHASADGAVSIGLNRAGEKKTLSVKLRKQSRSRSYAYSFGGGRRPAGIPPAPPARPFHFNMMMSQTVEGMELQKLSKQLAEYFEVSGGRGLLVTSVEKRSAAADAGLKAGDVIVKVNSSSVKDVETLRDELYDGDKTSAQIEIVRHGKAQSLTLKVEERGDDKEMEEEDDDDASLEMNVPFLPYIDHSSTRHSLSEANRDFLRDLHETLSQMQARIREKMLRLRERITDKALNM
jgi:membrane-associated protease RseP (regulator of RpoE activity)